MRGIGQIIYIQTTGGKLDARSIATGSITQHIRPQLR